MCFIIGLIYLTLICIEIEYLKTKSKNDWTSIDVCRWIINYFWKVYTIDDKKFHLESFLRQTGSDLMHKTKEEYHLLDSLYGEMMFDAFIQFGTTFKQKPAELVIKIDQPLAPVDCNKIVFNQTGIKKQQKRLISSFYYQIL